MARAWTEYEEETVDEMLRGGATVPQVARYLGRTLDSTLNFVRTHDVGFNPYRIDPDDSHLSPSLAEREALIAVERSHQPDLVAAMRATAEYERPPESLEIERERLIRDLKREVARCRKIACRNGWRPKPRRRARSLTA